MKRISITGLCLAAMFVCCASVASVAQAAEITSCVKAPRVKIEYKKEGKIKKKTIHEGKYENRACTELAPEQGEYPPYGPEGKFERGSAGAKFSTKSAFTLKKPKLEMPGGRVVNCNSSSGKGEWTGPKTGVETVVFKGCVLSTSGEKCTTGVLEPGEIKTAKLELTLISYPEKLVQENFEGKPPYEWQPEAGKPWVKSSVASGSYFLEYACGTTSFRSGGSVAGRIETGLNETLTKMKWYVGPGNNAQDLDSEYSEGGGASWASVGGKTEMSYEPAATVGGGIQVIEES